MHETSLINYALDAVEARAKELGVEEVMEVGLVIGRMKAVPQLMEHAFQIVRNRHPLCRNARLHLEMRDIRLRCLDCNAEFNADDAMSQFVCPECGSECNTVIEGNELLVDYFIPQMR